MPYNFCTLCLGNSKMDYFHVRSHRHLNNIKKLPLNYHLMTTDEVFKYLYRKANLVLCDGLAFYSRF